MTISLLLFAAVIAAAIAALLVTGRPRLPELTAFPPDRIDTDVEAYIAKREARFDDIRPDAVKQIVWADPATKAKTPLSIVYIHGFSAAAGEVRPLPDRVAADLGANLYFTRLRGHGRDGDAMAEATVESWFDDFAESLAIGERIGDKVIVMATSTGASLATVALAAPVFRDRVAAAVFLSPNYRVRAAGAFLLTMPFARPLARLVLGDRRAFEPVNALHAALWTTEYPVEAILPMAELVKLTGSADVGAINTPALFIFSPLDQVVDPEATRRMITRWGGPTATIDPEPSGDPNHHVNAGDALSPRTTAPLADGIVAWLNGIGGLR